MGDTRRFARRYADRNYRQRYLLCCFVSGIVLLIASVFLRAVGRNSSKCGQSLRRFPGPDVLFVTLVTSKSIHQSLKGLGAIDFGDQSCAFHIYASSEHDFEKLSTRYQGSCVGRGGACKVEIRYLQKLRMWGDISLQDISQRTLVIFLREGASFTTRALDWIRLAHRSVLDFYARGGRRHYAGAIIGCRGQVAIGPKWSESVGPLNTTCAFSPVRQGQEDLWAFFSGWFLGRRREWVSWPHIWDHEIAVPTFWKGKSKAKRDKKLIKFGEQTGTDYSYMNNPNLLWERWYARWAANYTFRIVSADSNLGLTIDDDGVISTQASERESSTLESTTRPCTRYGDAVHMENIWDEYVDGEFGKGYFAAIQTIVGHKPDMVSITIVNSKFIELTKSWLCNVQTGGFAPPNIYWITLDRESKEALDQAGVGQTVDITDALLAENMDPVNILYGQPAYWKLMLMRTRLIRDLLDRGIDVFLFETDQVWLQNPFNFMNRELDAGADMVGTLDTQHNVAGNTLLLRSVVSTRRMWSEVYYRFKLSYIEKDIVSQEKHSVTFVEHDQYQLSALLLYDTEFTQDFPVALALLNAQLFVGGSWYSGMYETEESKRPVIINNNFISGTEKKKSRAIIFGHWFLSEDGTTCNTAAVRKALQYEFAKLPGKWWAEEQKKLQQAEVR